MSLLSLESICTIAATVAAQSALEFLIRPVGRLRNAINIRWAIAHNARAKSPDKFSEVTCSWEADDRVTELASFSAVLDRFCREAEVESRTLLITGQYGSGKSVLSKKLASEFVASGNIFYPNYAFVLDAARFNSARVLGEIALQMQDNGIVGVSPNDIHRLTQTSRVAFLIDGLDQIPYGNTANGVLNAILDWVAECTNNDRTRATFCLLVRDELLRVSPELKQFVQQQKTPILRVRGFVSEDQIRNYVLTHDSVTGNERWLILQRQIEADRDFRDIVSVPVHLDRIVAIDFVDFKRCASMRVSLSERFRSSFHHLAEIDRRHLMDLAFRLYTSDCDYFTVNRELHARVGVELVNLTNCFTTGILTGTGFDCRFNHQSYRDYFAAEYIVGSIQENTGAQALSSRTMHYLVSEFVAGLLDQQSMIKLLQIVGDKNNDDLLRSNALDLLSEVEDQSMKHAVTRYVGEHVSEYIVTEWTPHAMFMAAVAGVFGQIEPVRRLIDYAGTIGVNKFLDSFFVTKDGFKYYANSRDHWVCEWIKVLELPKYGYIRCLAAYIFGEQKEGVALPALQRLEASPNEDAEVRLYATRALEKMRGSASTP